LCIFTAIRVTHFCWRGGPRTNSDSQTMLDSVFSFFDFPSDIKRLYAPGIPIHSSLIGLSPVNMSRSYKKPPNVQPKNGATIGTLHRVSKLDHQSIRQHRYRPKVVSSSAPHLVSISEEIRHETRSEISGKIDSVACLPTPACSDAENDEEETEWCEIS
jgi:hypothetical protein